MVLMDDTRHPCPATKEFNSFPLNSVAYQKSFKRLLGTLADAKSLYEKLYCERGDRENRIKEHLLDLLADHTGTAMMRADQPPVVLRRPRL